MLDPLGATLENGPKLYFELIRNMANSLKDCLIKLGLDQKPNSTEKT